MAYIDRQHNDERLISGISASGLVGMAAVLALSYTITITIPVKKPLEAHNVPEDHFIVDPLPVPQQPTHKTNASMDHFKTIKDTNLPLNHDVYGDSTDVKDPPIVLDPVKIDLPVKPHPSLAKGAALVAGRDIFNAENYPNEAIYNREHGITHAHYTIGENGRAQNCSTDGAPSQSLARQTCRLIIKEFRFQPARDADGTAIAEERDQRVVWTLPDE